ncbi:MAG TPA: endonuclease/exonuclease/phosphatase family protein [Polyangiaceae bacterium]|nr:endonuclease/exonuclease/phosphatase family protein [Polyangiaceae bacterium]
MIAKTPARATVGLLALMAAACAAPDDGDTEGSEAQSVEASAATRTVKVLHWNISGAVLNKGFNEVVDKMFAEFDARRPDVVSINEGCRDQVEHLRDRIKSKGYPVTLQFAPTGNNALCVHSFGTNTAQSGPAVLIVGGGTIGRNYYWQGTTSVDERTDRGMACLTGNLGRPVRFCSLHLATADAVAAAQAESMLVRFGQSFIDAPAVLVGDFNAPPAFLQQNAPHLYRPGGMFFEADAIENKPTHGEGKLDYLFMSGNHFAESAKVEVKDMGTHDPWWGDRRAYSDHRLVYGELTLNL